MSTPDMEWWTASRFGAFMHWGPCTLSDAEISWGRAGVRPGHSTAEKGVPADEYDDLYKRFDPRGFDAGQWARMIRDAGAGYLIFTTKHHDGFCMFDSALTEHDIASTPFGRDIARELADACREAGIRIFWYYSQPDWSHPDYLTDNHARYVEYLHGQIRELLTEYGKIDGVWFDGLGRSGADWDAERLERLIRDLQPGIIINTRIARELSGDFDTPEGHVGPFQIDRPWETCMSMHNGWSWHENPRIKSLKDCLHVLVRCAGGGGNLALNVGPRPDGTIHPEMVERYREIGRWLAKYGRAIRGTTGGPWVFPESEGLAATRSGNSIFLHVLERKPDGRIELPDIGAAVSDVQVLTGGSARIEQNGRTLVLHVEPDAADELDTIVELSLEVGAADIKPVSVIDHSAVSAGKPATSSGSLSDAHPASHCFDNDLSTYWKGSWHKPRSGDSSGWIEVDLERECDIARAMIYGGRGVRSHQLQYRSGDRWITFHEGRGVDGLAVDVRGVRARRVRLFMEYWFKPEIYEFQVFERR